MTEKGCYIDSLPGTGLVTFLALVKEKEIRPKRAGGWYLYLLLGDRTGEIEAKAWEKPQEVAGLLDRDDIVKVRDCAGFVAVQAQSAKENGVRRHLQRVGVCPWCGRRTRGNAHGRHVRACARKAGPR